MCTRGSLNLSSFTRWVFIFCLSISSLFAGDPIHLSLKSENKAVKAGEPFWVALDVTVEPGWHLYWKNPGDVGMAPQIEWVVPDGYKIDALEWPVPEKSVTEDITSYGYSKPTVILARVIPSGKESSSIPVEVRLKWLACNDSTCRPGESTSRVALQLGTVSELEPEVKSYFENARGRLPEKVTPIEVKKKADWVESVVDLGTHQDEALKLAYFCPEEAGVIDANEPIAMIQGDSPSQWKMRIKTGDAYKPDNLKGVLVIGDKGYEIAMADDAPVVESLPTLGLILAFAFIGGVILNLMPCVLPVLSLKVLHFVQIAGQDRKKVFFHGLAFTFGVLISFWSLASVLLALQAYGHSVGWGFQLQQPLFVAILAALMLLFALSLFGVFEMGTFFASWAGEMKVQHAEGLQASFWSGVLATAVATPCTGPFLGTAVGYAFTVPPLVCLLIFTVLGLGLSAPYLLLSMCPSLMRFVPRPGSWMESFKQAMGFLMVLAVLWLLWVFGHQTDMDALIILLSALFSLSVASWILGRWGTILNSSRVRKVSYIAILLLTGLSGALVYFASEDKLEANQLVAQAWEPFSSARLKELTDQGTPVIVDFTAKWCLICQVNHAVLNSPSVDAKFVDRGVVRLKADWTKYDPEITDELKKHGRNSVPLYVLYKGDNKPQILPQVLTSEIVLNELDTIKK